VHSELRHGEVSLRRSWRRATHTQVRVRKVAVSVLPYITHRQLVFTVKQCGDFYERRRYSLSTIESKVRLMAKCSPTLAR